MELLRKFYQKEVKPELQYFFLAGVVLFFTLLRIPSLIEPNWYGDEGIYQVIGRALNSGRILYSEIWDNKPPLLYLYYAIFNGDQFYTRLLSLAFGIGAVVTFYFVARNIFVKKITSVYISTIVFAFLFGLPLLEGNIANAENFMLFPILLSLLLITKLKSNSSFLVPVFAGLFLSIAFLTKIVALFDLCAFIVILFTLRFYDKNLIDVKKHFLARPVEFLKVLKQEGLIVISFCIPIFLVALFFFSQGIFSDFFKAAFSQNVGYVGYGNYFLIPQGLLYLKILSLVTGIIAVVLLRKQLGVAGVVIYVWTLFSVFNAFFSGRPYTHYVLVVLPVFCLFLGFLFQKMELRKRVFHCMVFLIVLLLLRNNFWIYTKIVPYYSNYINFIQDNKSLENYYAFFDKITPRDYEIARFINANTTPDDNVFLVSDSGQIYYLSSKLPPGRYIVAYHVTFYKDGILETKKAIDQKNPKYIIVTKKGNIEQNFLQNYELRYLLGDVTIYEREN